MSPMIWNSTSKVNSSTILVGERIRIWVPQGAPSRSEASTTTTSSSEERVRMRPPWPTARIGGWLASLSSYADGLQRENSGPRGAVVPDAARSSSLRVRSNREEQRDDHRLRVRQCAGAGPEHHPRSARAVGARGVGSSLSPQAARLRARRAEAARVHADQPVRQDPVDRRRRVPGVRVGGDRALRRREVGPPAPGDARGARARGAVGVRRRQHRRTSRSSSCSRSTRSTRISPGRRGVVPPSSST